MNDLKRHIENAIRKGDRNTAFKAINSLEMKQIPRSEILTFARFARRIRHFKFALKLLNPIVRPKTHKQKPPSDNEIIEYAASIRGMGSPSEALSLTESIDGFKTPQVYLERAFCFFTQWDYEKAIPELKLYVQNDSLSDYERAVGTINLCSALIANKNYQEAESLLLQTLDDIEKNDYKQLNLNCRELLSQVHILFYENFEKAIEILTHSIQTFPGSPNEISLLFAEKWLAIAISLQQNKCAPLLEEARKKARKLKHGETLRELDFYQALIENNHEKLIWQYFGTPFQSFREKIIEKSKVSIPKHWERRFGEGGNKIDLTTGTMSNGVELFKVGSVLHKLFLFLNDDFYQNKSTLSIFSKLYPSQHYCSYTSANRIQKNLSRLNQLFVDNELPFEVKSIHNKYTLEISGPINLVYSSQLETSDRTILLMEKLRDQVSPDQFTAKEAGKVLEISRSNTQRLLVEAVHQEMIEKVSKGRNSFYRFLEVS